jgi:hypothetical protein
VLVPFTLRLTAPVRLMLLDLADDPVYSGFEVQWVDSPEVGGAGIVLLAVRGEDGRADVLSDESLAVPRADYEIGTGIREFCRVPVSPGRFDITDAGAQVDVGLTLPDGRDLRLHVREARTRPRPLVRMLAPAGHSMTDPRFFPFFWMDDMWFLRWPGASVEVRIAGQRRRVVRAGVPWRLVRYATGPLTALWCEQVSGPVPEVSDEAGEHRVGSAWAQVTRLPHTPALSGLEVRRDARRLAITFDPPFPSLTEQPDGVVEGRVSAWAADRVQFGGTYRGRRSGDDVHLEILVDQPWDPGPQTALASALFRLLTVFRTWPTTYRWSADLDLASDPPRMSSRWSR